MHFKTTSFELFDGTKCQLHAITGEVIEHESSESTELHSNNSANGLEIHTKKTLRQSVWLRDPDGREQKYSLDDVAPLAVRQGHKIALAFVETEQTKETMFVSFARNLETGEVRKLNDSALLKRAMPKPFKRYGAHWLMWAVVVGCSYGLYAMPRSEADFRVPLYFIGIIAAFALMLVRRVKYSNRLEAQLKERSDAFTALH